MEDSRKTTMSEIPWNITSPNQPMIVSSPHYQHDVKGLNQIYTSNTGYSGKLHDYPVISQPHFIYFDPNLHMIPHHSNLSPGKN
jgi:hypothetical protein